MPGAAAVARAGLLGPRGLHRVRGMRPGQALLMAYSTRGRLGVPPRACQVGHAVLQQLQVLVCGVVQPRPAAAACRGLRVSPAGAAGRAWETGSCCRAAGLLAWAERQQAASLG